MWGGGARLIVRSQIPVSFCVCLRPPWCCRPPLDGAAEGVEQSDSPCVCSTRGDDGPSAERAPRLSAWRGIVQVRTRALTSIQHAAFCFSQGIALSRDTAWNSEAERGQGNVGKGIACIACSVRSTAAQRRHAHGRGSALMGRPEVTKDGSSRVVLDTACQERFVLQRILRGWRDDLPLRAALRRYTLEDGSTERWMVVSASGAPLSSTCSRKPQRGRPTFTTPL